MKDLVRTTKTEVAKRSLNDILDLGLRDVTEWMANFQHIVFLCDASDSMREAIGPETDGPVEDRRKWVILKKALRRYVEQKFAETMPMRIVTFSHYASVVVEAGRSRGELLEVIDALPFAGGDTRLARGLQAALAILRKSRQLVPHIVLITDGDPKPRRRVVDLVEKECNRFAVIDCIFVGHRHGTDYQEFLKAICRATGGVYEQITSAAEFERKVLAVASRGLLPPPPRVLSGTEH